MESRKSSGLGCLFGFLSPFLVAGLAGGVISVREGMNSSPDWEVVTLGAIFCLVFAGGALAMLYRGHLIRKRDRALARLKALHPDEPWRWREDWAMGRALSATGTRMLQAWALTLALGVVSVPAVWKVPEEVAKGNDLALLALVFPVVGFFLLIWAVRATLRYRRFGGSVVELSSLPGVIGGSASGTLHAKLDSIPSDGVELSLRCVHRYVRRSGNSRETREKILWEQTERVGTERIFSGYTGAAIPFAFRVPADMPESRHETSDDRILWILLARARVPGVDFDAEFELPVFRTASSTAPATAADPVSPRPPARAVEAPSRPTVRIATTSTGGMELYFPAARHPKVAFSWTAFLGIWVGSIWLQVYLGAPTFFPVVFSLFGLLILYAALELWFGTIRVVVEMGELRVKNAMLGLGRTVRLLPAEIADVRTKIHMQSGGRAGSAYYQIDLIRDNGRKLVAGSQIRDKREANWLVAELKKALNATRR